MNSQYMIYTLWKASCFSSKAMLDRLAQPWAEVTKLRNIVPTLGATMLTLNKKVTALSGGPLSTGIPIYTS